MIKLHAKMLKYALFAFIAEYYILLLKYLVRKITEIY